MAKKLLKKAQQQLAAKHREKTIVSIMDACCDGNKETFVKLIKKQRQLRNAPTSIIFGEHDSPGDELESWASYCACLDTPKNDELFDDSHHRHQQVAHLLQALTTADSKPGPVSQADVKSFVNSLKNNKAADVYGVCAEHIKLSSPVILDII